MKIIGYWGGLFSGRAHQWREKSWLSLSLGLLMAPTSVQTSIIQLPLWDLSKKRYLHNGLKVANPFYPFNPPASWILICWLLSDYCHICFLLCMFSMIWLNIYTSVFKESCLLFFRLCVRWVFLRIFFFFFYENVCFNRKYFVDIFSEKRIRFIN